MTKKCTVTYFILFIALFAVSSGEKVLAADLCLLMKKI